MTSPERLSELASRLCDAGSLTPEEERELGLALRGSADARRLVLSYMRLEGAFLEQGRAGLLSTPIAARPATRPTPSAPWIPWAAGLAAAALVVAMILFAQNGSAPPPPASITRAPDPAPKTLPPPESPRAPETPAPKTQPPLEAPKPAPAPESPAPPPVVAEEPATVEPVLAARPLEQEAVAVEVLIERAEGDVTVTAGGAKKAARAGDAVKPGQSVETGPGKSLAVIAFPDGSRLEARAATQVRDIREKSAKGGKSLTLQHGTLWAQVRPQPEDRPFLIQTPRGEARVLGTVFTLSVDNGLRLDVQEGRVRFTRSGDNKSVDVAAGHSASSGQGADLALLRSQDVIQSFQDGRYPAPDYAGTRDTTLAEKSPQANYGAAKTLAVESEDPKEKKKASWALLRWDLSAVPPGSLVRSVQVTVHVLEPSHGQAFYLFEPSRAWSEKEASWKLAAAGAVWRFPGSLGAPERWPAALGTIAPLQKGEYTTELGDAGEALVQSWINAPAANLGLELASALPGAGLRLSSREAPLPEHRPRLTVTYTPKK